MRPWLALPALLGYPPRVTQGKTASIAGILVLFVL